MLNYVYASILVLVFVLCFFIYKFFAIKDKKMQVNRYKFFSRIYTRLSAIPIFGRHLSNVYNRLYSNNPEEILTIRYKAINYFLISLIGFGVSMTILWMIYGKDLYMCLAVLLISLFIRSAILDYLIGDDTKLLNALVDFLADVKHSYQLHNMVQASVLEATEKAKPLMNLHGKKLYEGIMNQDCLQSFYSNTNNKHLKNFAGHAFLTKEYGDKKINDISLYLKNVNFIISEIKLELKKKEGIKYRLMFISTLSVIPVLSPILIEAWMRSNFSVANFFYNSIWGDLSKFLIMLISITCYLMARYLKKTSTVNSKIEIPSNWDKVLFRNKLIKFVVTKIFEPSKKDKAYYKAHDLLQESASHYDFHGLYLRKCLCFLLGLIISMSFFISLHKTSALDILNNASYRFLNESTRLATMDGEVIDINVIDHQILKDAIREKSSKIDNDKLLSMLEERGIDIHDPQALESIVALSQTLNEKLNSYYKESFKWWELIISIIIAFFLMDLPTWILWFKRYLRKADMEDEIFQFNTIILLLMHHETVSVSVILEWMERFSDIFFNPIRKCIINLQSGTTQSLNELKTHSGSAEEVNYIKAQSGPLYALQGLREDVKYKAFTRLVDNLISADKIGVLKAFEALESERSFYTDERKEATERTVNNRGILGEMVGLFPAYATMILHLVFPLLWAASIKFNEIYTMFNLKK